MTTTDPAGDETRFAFGENWKRFLDVVDEARVREARRSVEQLVGSVEGARVLDLGSGSGLFSLALVSLGAAEVVSVDYDHDSVAATDALRGRYAPGTNVWSVRHGDATDAAGMAALGTFDVVYSWGVLHHTGDLWGALGNAAGLVVPGGLFALSVYNDQGLRSRLWTKVKRGYHRVPPSLRPVYVAGTMAPRELLYAASTVARGRPGEYVRAWTHYSEQRGMSRWHDFVDWVGGYPFEVAKPEEVFAFCRERGFTLEALTTRAGGLGCNEFRFRRDR